MKLFGIFLLSVLLLFGCTLSKMVKLADQMHIEVHPNPAYVSVNQSTVDLNLALSIPPGFLKGGSPLIFSVFYKEAGSSTLIDSFQLNPNSGYVSLRTSRPISFYRSYVNAGGQIVIIGNIVGTNKTTPELPIGAIVVNPL